MITLFVLHIVFFSGFALALTLLARPIRTVSFYVYLSVILILGGFLGNAYSLPLSDSITVSGGNLAYGAFMLSAVLFVLAERDIFILRRLIILVIAVDFFNILLSILISQTFAASGTINPHGTPAALFQNSTHLIILGGMLIVVELAVMLFLFEYLKRVLTAQFLLRAAYLATFVAILCLDGIAFPLIAFGTAPEVVAIVFGGLSGKFLTAVSYSLAILAFMAVFPSRFSSYLQTSVFTWRTLLSTSSELLQDLKEMDAQLSESKSQLAHSAELAGLGYAVSDMSTMRVVKCDEAYARMHGITVADFAGLKVDSEIIGRMIHPDDREKSLAMIERVKNGETVIGEWRHVLPDGKVRTLRKVFSPVDPKWQTSTLVELVGQDITETRELQERLFQSQKMDAIGKLTGGVAHDFNNLLAVTMGNLELLDDEVQEAGQKALIQNALNSTRRGAELTKNMLSFARKARLDATIVNLNQIVRDAQSWISRTLPSTIKVDTDLSPALWRIKIDAASAESGLLNLILNARDAMPNGGNLTITTSNLTIEEGSEDAQRLEIAPGRYVLLTVKDTGGGISPDYLKNIFDPFFTTKPVGKGSGLGLSMVEGFMQQSGGAVRVESAEGGGTTFRLFFLASDELLDASAVPSAAKKGDDVAQTKTVLLVEDNLDVLVMMRKTLEKFGYRVVQAMSGDEACQVFKEEPGIDLLLTDFVMPGKLQGDTLAAALRQMRPDLPVVFMSGYAGDDTLGPGKTDADDIRLMKPVGRQQLLDAVRKALLPSGPSGSQR